MTEETSKAQLYGLPTDIQIQRYTARQLKGHAHAFRHTALIVETRKTAEWMRTEAQRVIDEQNQLIEKLLETLKPFGELSKQFDGASSTRPKEGIIQAWHHNKHGEGVLTVEMLNQALQLHQDYKSKQK